MSAPEISILLPVRDGAEWLDEAMASLAAQTFEDFEVLAVDDGSNDATPDILDGWADRDARVRVLRTAVDAPATDRGIVPALERARVRARGRYLARMDADDRAHPRRLELQRGLLETTPTLVGCGCRVRYFPRDEVREGALRYERWLNASVTPDEVARAMFVECPLAHPTFFLRADAVERAGGWRDPGWPEDYDLVLRLWAAGGRLAKVPEVLLDWRERPDRLSRTHARYSPEAFRRCKVHWLGRTVLEGRDGAVIWGSGPVGKAFSRELGRQGHTVRAFADVDPRKLGQEIHGAPVLDTRAALERRDSLHLCAVGQEGVRRHLRTLLEGAGLTPGSDFVAVA